MTLAVNHNTNKSWSKGHFFIENQLFKEKDINQHLLLQKFDSENICSKILRSYNGHFAIITINNGQIIAAVDRVRSIPLFYSLKNNAIYISDDAYWLDNQVNPEKTLDRTSVAEYLLVGYVTGQRTLVKQISQLQAGEYLIANVANGLWDIKTKRYYTFTHNEESFTKKQLLEKLDVAINNSLTRLIKFANGNTIALPLSGGIDSRLLAIKLTQMGYSDKIITYSYGKKSNGECVIGNYVADKLNIKWIHVPYDNDLWSNFIKSRTFLNFNKTADQLSAHTYIRPFPADAFLLENRFVPKDAVFAPGHTLDTVSGSHIPPHYADIKTVNTKKIIDHIFSKYYMMWSIDFLKRMDLNVKLEQIKSRIQNCLYESQYASYSVEKASDLIEGWIWQERQAKAIVNMMRIQEFLGYKWHLPYWDNEFLDFWSDVSFKFRLNRTLCHEYMAPFNKQLFPNIPEIATTKKPLKQRIKSIIRIQAVKVKYFKKLFRKRVFKNQGYGEYGIVSNEMFDFTWNHAKHPHSYWVYNKILDLQKEYNF